MVEVKRVGVGEYKVTDGSENLVAEIDSCIAVMARVSVKEADGSINKKRRGFAHVYNSGSGIKENRDRDTVQAKKTLDDLFRDLEIFADGDSRKGRELSCFTYVVGIPSSSVWNFMGDYVLKYLEQRRITSEVNLSDQRDINPKRDVVGGLSVAYKQIVFKEDGLVIVDKDPNKKYDLDDVHRIIF